MKFRKKDLGCYYYKTESTKGGSKKEGSILKDEMIEMDIE